MYFLDMMGLGALVERVQIVGMAIIIIIFVTLVCLTIIAVRKSINSGTDESGKKNSGTMLKVLIVLDCLFFVVLSFIF